MKTSRRETEGVSRNTFFLLQNTYLLSVPPSLSSLRGRGRLYLWKLIGSSSAVPAARHVKLITPSITNPISYSRSNDFSFSFLFFSFFAPFFSFVEDFYTTDFLAHTGTLFFQPRTDSKLHTTGELSFSFENPKEMNRRIGKLCLTACYKL